MSYQYLTNKFLEKTGYLEDDNILAIVVYGSRVTRKHKDTSDLDIFIITSRKTSYKGMMIIDGIKIDYNIYAERKLFQKALEERENNNSYFSSILKTGQIIKNKNGILESLSIFLEKIEIPQNKKRLSHHFITELQKLYELFLTTKEDFWYYNLLEKLRIAYSYLKNYSYISMIKVYDIFSNSEEYEKIYDLNLPDKNFMALFLKGVLEKDNKSRLEIINLIINNLGLDLNGPLITKDSFSYLSSAKAQYELLILHNKILKAIEYLENNHPYANYVYSVLLNQIYQFYLTLYGTESPEINNAIRDIPWTNKDDKIKILNKLFAIIEKDYRFDYDNYMLKLII